VGFEHCDGPHADLSPGSPDLDLLGKALAALSKTQAPDVGLFNPKGRLGFEHPAMDGDTLVHTDLCPANLIVTPDGLRIVDWAMATKAAPWVELAVLTQWLIGSGHTPEQAEQWLARYPAWGEVGPDVLDDFAAKNAAKWASKAQPNSPSWMHDLADWTGQWSTYRLRRPHPRPQERMVAVMATRRATRTHDRDTSGRGSGGPVPAATGAPPSGQPVSPDHLA
jgi:hypothetical protein